MYRIEVVKDRPGMTTGEIIYTQRFEWLDVSKLVKEINSAYWAVAEKPEKEGEA